MTSIVNNDEIPLSLTQGIKFKKLVSSISDSPILLLPLIDLEPVVRPRFVRLNSSTIPIPRRCIMIGCCNRLLCNVNKKYKPFSC